MVNLFKMNLIIVMVLFFTSNCNSQDTLQSLPKNSSTQDPHSIENDALHDNDNNKIDNINSEKPATQNKNSDPNYNDILKPGGNIGTTSSDDNNPCKDNNCEVSLSEQCQSNVRALVFIDDRLYQLLKNEINTYLNLACDRRKFGIDIFHEHGLDDVSPQQIRAKILQKLANFPELEGVLFIGNIKLSTFFLPRADILTTRYWPRYFEDLDMKAQKLWQDGTQMNVCSENSPLPCFVNDFNGNNGSTLVPPHDFDDVTQGDSFGPEIWAAFLPVGFSNPLSNSYKNFAEQLLPFFKKVLHFYQNPIEYDRSFYHVGNDINLVEKFLPIFWNLIGPDHIDYYSIHPQGESFCKDNPNCYTRVPLENYTAPEEFISYAQTLPWIGEGWQSSNVFIGHMNSFLRRVVTWNTHGMETWALLSSQEVEQIQENHGGALAIIMGCGVAGFKQPGNTSFVDTAVSVENNLLINIIYGRSAFVATTGTTHIRGHADEFQVILQKMYQEHLYLGQAHKERLLYQDQLAGDVGYELRGKHEILLGDPFLDVNE